MSRLQHLSSYACYYGAGQLEQLQRFSLAILQPDNYSPNEIEKLRAQGTLTLGYLSLIESADTLAGAAWYLRDSAGQLIKNPHWNTYYCDTREPAWTAHLLTTRIPAIVKQRQFDGLFLDTLDSQDLFPAIRYSTIELVHTIRAEFPDTLLVANRGFSILDKIAADVDGVMFECFSTYFQDGRYSAWDTTQSADNARLAQQINGLRRSCPFALLALDYALPGDAVSIEYAARRARDFGCLPYVSTAHLDQIYFLPGTA